MPAPRKYPDERRERAIREVRTTGRPIAHVAKDLGIHKEPCVAGSARPRLITANAMTG
jgi:transposase-like protein